MRIFHIHGDQFNELPALPDAAPPAGYLWVGIARAEFETNVANLQGALQRWTGGQLVDLHVSDLLNPQLPSHFDYTSWYDLLVFRRLAALGATDDLPATAVTRIDTSPVGFAVFDRVLLTVHPADCMVREYFANRLQQQAPSADGRDVRNNARMPPSPADMTLRMVNHMVDSYLELRRLLTRQLDQLQQELFGPSPQSSSWKLLLDSRNGLHLLEDTCEDQRAAITEWIDALDELPPDGDAAVLRERELLRVRSRDVLEHIERVLVHVRRLESSAENAVQMHFSAQSNRTNEIMRTLTTLTAIFLPLNLVTGFFGMNFDTLPGIHSPRAFWITFGVMLMLGVGMSLYFWRKRYLSRPPK
ncbi:MAG TPA: magnesium transporter CorA family protein [Burkholderiaceae bacterium]